MGSSRVAIACASALMLFCGAATHAQNVIDNGSFETGPEPWPVWENSQIKVSYRDDVGSTLTGGSGPGSIEVVTTFWSGSAAGTTQTVELDGGRDYHIAASVFRPTADNSARKAFVMLELFDGSNKLVDSLSLDDTSVPGVWARLTGTITASSEVASGRLWLGVVTSFTAGETRPGIVILDDAVVAPVGPATVGQNLWVPAGAAAHGLNQTYWSTGGWFSNLTDATLSVSGALLRQGESNLTAVNSPTSLGTIPPRGFLKLDDLVSMLGGSEVAGGLFVQAIGSGNDLPSELMTLTTHTFTPNPFGGGVYGQGIPAVAAGDDPTTAIPGVFQGAELRTNIGALNTSGLTLTLEVTVLGPNGNEVASATWTLLPYEQRQVSLPSLGVTSLGGGTVVFELEGDGSYRGYTSTVDQLSGDAVYNPAR